MISQTTLVNIRSSIRPSKQLHSFINELYNDSEECPWFCAKDGNEFFFRQQGFFSEFQSVWNKCLLESCQPSFDEFFQGIKWDKDVIGYPRIEILETYEGSWIIEAALIVATTASTTYHVLKGLSEIPDIVEGIQKLKEMLSKKFNKNINCKATDIIARCIDGKGTINSSNVPIMDTDIIIDARPLLALSPVDLCEHTIHIKVSVTSSGIVVENLSDDVMKNLHIGLFNNQTERHNWYFRDAYIKHIVSLSGHQTIAIDFTDFIRDGEVFVISEFYDRLDCWVQDNTGIYLFNFILPNK
jgi:hypothetical protein